MNYDRPIEKNKRVCATCMRAIQRRQKFAFYSDGTVRHTYHEHPEAKASTVQLEIPGTA